MQRIEAASGAAIEVRTTITSITSDPILAATLEQGGTVASVELDDHATFGKRYDVDLGGSAPMAASTPWSTA